MLQLLCPHSRACTYSLVAIRGATETREKSLLPATRESLCIAMKTMWNKKRQKKLKKNFFLMAKKALWIWFLKSPYQKKKNKIK